jgi:hypothetical protein
MIYAVFTVLFSQAGVTSAQVKDSIPQKVENYFRYNYDNDFFSATDRYYTQGIRFELILNAFKHNPVSALLPRLNKNTKNYYGIAFERDGFTPRSIRHDSVYYGERPYAGTTFLSSFRYSVDTLKKQRLFSQLDLGIIGPASLGKEEQQYIHRKLKNIQPLGWQHQVANDIVVNYTLQYEKGIFMRKGIELIGMAEVRAGTLYDDASIGGTLRVGRMQPYFNNLGLSKVGNKRFQWYLFARGRVKAVGYNATMQGGVFNKSSEYTLRDSEITRIVGLGYVGVVIAYKRVSLEYTKAYISREFVTGLEHGWGHCNVSVCF